LFGTPVLVMPIESGGPSGWSTHPRHPWLLVDCRPVRWVLPVAQGRLGDRYNLRLTGTSGDCGPEGWGGVGPVRSESLSAIRTDAWGDGAQPGHENDAALMALVVAMIRGTRWSPLRGRHHLLRSFAWPRLRCSLELLDAESEGARGSSGLDPRAQQPALAWFSSGHPRRLKDPAPGAAARGLVSVTGEAMAVATRRESLVGKTGPAGSLDCAGLDLPPLSAGLHPPDHHQRGGGQLLAALNSFLPTSSAREGVSLVVSRLFSGSNIALKTQPASRAPTDSGASRSHNWPTAWPRDPERHTGCCGQGSPRLGTGEFTDSGDIRGQGRDKSARPAMSARAPVWVAPRCTSQGKTKVRIHFDHSAESQAVATVGVGTRTPLVAKGLLPRSHFKTGAPSWRPSLDHATGDTGASTWGDDVKAAAGA